MPVTESLIVELRADLTRFRGGMAEFERTIGRQQKEIANLRNRLAGLGGAAEETSRSFRAVGRRGQAASGTVIELSRVVQDARYGFIGVANNVEQTAGQFSSLVAKSGGVGAALRGVGAALAGPAGLLLAFSTLIALGPSIINFFRDSEEAAEDAADAYKEAAEAALNLNLPEGVQVENAAQANRALKDQQTQVKVLEQSVASLREEYELIQLVLNNVGGVRGQTAREVLRLKFGVEGEEELREAAEAFEELEKEVERAEGRVKALQEAFETLSDREANVQAFQALGLTIKETADAGEDLGDKVTDALDGITAAAFDARAALELVREDIFATLGRDELGLFESNRARNKQLRGALQGPGRIQQPGVEELPRAYQELTRYLREANDLQLQFFRIGMDGVDALSQGIGDIAANLLFFGNGLSEAEERLTEINFQEQQQYLREALAEGHISTERFNAEMEVLQERWDEFRDSVSLVGRAFQSFGSLVQGVFAQITAQIAAAIAKFLILQGLNLIPGFGQSGIGGFITSALGGRPSGPGGFAGQALSLHAGTPQIVGTNIVTPITLVSEAGNRGASLNRRLGIDG